MRRLALAVGLLIFALLWVAGMGLLFGGGGGSSSRPAQDGSRANIKYIDLSAFYKDDAGQVALRLDIHDPQSKPLLGLNKDMLTLTEQGNPAEILQFNGPGTQALNVILVIDVSGSMGEQNKMQGAVDAALAAVEQLQVGRDRLGVISFDNQFEIVQPLTRMTSDAKATCRQRISMLRPQGGTTIGPPTQAALNLFQQALPDGPKLLMVMTDGEDSGLPGYVEMIVEQSQATGVPVYTITFGGMQDGKSVTVLQDLATRCNGQYFHAPSGEQLAEIYRSQLKELSEEFSIVYHSPFPRADGLPRNVALKIDAPVGTLMAGKSYSIGSIVDSGGRQPATTTGGKPAAATGVSGGAKLAIFMLLFIGLSAALALPSIKDLQQASRADAGNTAKSGSPAMNSPAGSASGMSTAGRPPAAATPPGGTAGRGPKMPPPPPGKTTPAPKPGTPPTARPASSAPVGSGPVVTGPIPTPPPTPRPAAPPAAPRPAVPAAPSGSSESLLPAPPPPPKSTGGTRPLPPTTAPASPATGNKKTIRPIPPPPPPPGGAT